MATTSMWRAFVSGMFLLFAGFQGGAQPLNVSVTNSLRYGSGSENIGEGGFFAKERKEYLDNLTDVRLFVDRFTLGFRLDVSEPPEYGIPFKGLRKRFVEFTQGPVDIRAGDLYDLFGRGLSLNLFENRALGFDNGIDGIRVRYRTSLLNVTLLGGDLDFVEPLSIAVGPVMQERHRVRAGRVELRPLPELRIGGSYVWDRTVYPSFLPDDEDTSTSRLPEVFAGLSFGPVDLYASYVVRSCAINGTDSVDGSGCYAALSLTGDGYGITAEYKDYRFDIVDPITRTIQYRPTRMSAIQNPPTVHKEHSFTLLTRYPHVADFNDDVGVQIDAYYAPLPSLTLNVNGSLSSRHYAYTFDRQIFAAVETRDGASWIPSLHGERSPFWELYLDAEWYYGGDDAPDSYVKAGVDRRSETFFEMFHATSPLQSFRMTAVPLQVLHAFSGVWSVKATSEHQWVSTFAWPEDHAYYNHLLSLTVARSPDITFGLRYEYTTSDLEPNGTRHWIVGEAGYKIGTNHLVGISYGSERGGQICSSGICRIVYPFTGFRCSLISTL